MDSATPQGQSGLSLSNLSVKAYRFKLLVLRNWWILAITISIGLAYQAWKVFNQPRLFESTSSISIREATDASGDKNKFDVPGDAFVGTTLAMLKNSQVLEMAKNDVALNQPKLKGEPPDIAPAQVPRSYIFTVTGRGADPEYTQAYVDAVVKNFINFRVKERDKSNILMGGALGEGVKQAEAEAAAAKAKFNAFIVKNDMPFWKDQARQSSEFLSGLKIRRATLDTEMNRLRMMTPEQLLNSPAQAPKAGPGGGTEAVSTDGVLYTQYIKEAQDLALAQARYEEQKLVWKEKHPKLQLLKAQMDGIQRRIGTIRTQIAEASKARIDSIQAEMKSLDDGIETWKAKANEASGKDIEYNVLNAEVVRLEAQASQRRDELSRIYQSKTGGVIDIFTILQPATVAYEVPTALAKHLLMGMFGGLVLGIAILLVLDKADDRMTSSTEMMEQFSEPILGQIPDVMDSRGEAGLPLLQLEDERYTYAEAFRSLRSSLIFMPSQGELRTLLVTSAIPNEGKSTISCNLAITMAASGANVILVDADLRRGDLASLFDTDGRTGLSNVLRGEATWEDAAQTTKYPNLTLIPRGPVTSQSSELLLLPSVTKLLGELKENFDLVLFNTAPILATDDTPTLSPHFDGSLMVIRAQFTSARLTKNALNALYQRQVNVLGMILNCVDTEMPDYYYYRYPKYYAAK